MSNSTTWQRWMQSGPPPLSWRREPQALRHCPVGLRLLRESEISMGVAVPARRLEDHSPSPSFPRALLAEKQRARMRHSRSPKWRKSRVVGKQKHLDESVLDVLVARNVSRLLFWPQIYQQEKPDFHLFLFLKWTQKNNLRLQTANLGGSLSSWL